MPPGAGVGLGVSGFSSDLALVGQESYDGCLAKLNSFAPWPIT